MLRADSPVPRVVVVGVRFLSAVALGIDGKLLMALDCDGETGLVPLLNPHGPRGHVVRSGTSPFLQTPQAQGYDGWTSRSIYGNRVAQWPESRVRKLDALGYTEPGIPREDKGPSIVRASFRRAVTCALFQQVAASRAI